MRFLICVFILFLSTAFVGKFQNQPKTVTLVLSIEHAEAVLAALSKMPYETAAPIIQTIQQQAYAQLNPPSPPPDTTGKKKEEPKNKKN